jgi:hypothetical protein
MDILNRIFGDQPEPRDDAQGRATPRSSSSGQLTDEQAIDRYRYLLRTAPPEAIEQSHAEAFAQLTPEQRRQVLEGLSQNVPPQERTGRDDPESLARLATRAELRRPGTLESTFGGMYPGGFGGLMAGNILSTIAGVVVGSAIADAIFSDGGYDQGYADGAAAADDAAESGDAGFDFGDSGDFGGGDFGGGDFGGEF